MARKVAMSAKTGRFVSKATAARHPSNVVRVTVGGKASGARSAATGRFVKAATAARHPGTTVTH